MTPLPVGDVFLTVGIMIVTFVVEIALFTLIGMSEWMFGYWANCGSLIRLTSSARANRVRGISIPSTYRD